MHLEVVTSVADWLAGIGPAVGKGVNDFLEGVPRLEGHEAPPEIAVVADPFRDDRAASFEAPPRFPALYVLPDGPVVAEGELGPMVRTADSVGVAIRYIVRKSSNSRSAIDAAYTLRAIGRSLVAYLDDDEAGRAGRSRNGIMVVTCNTYTYGSWREAVGEAQAIAVFGLDLAVRDTAPRGTPG